MCIRDSSGSDRHVKPEGPVPSVPAVSRRQLPPQGPSLTAPSPHPHPTSRLTTREGASDTCITKADNIYCNNYNDGRLCKRDSPLAGAKCAVQIVNENSGIDGDQQHSVPSKPEPVPYTSGPDALRSQWRVKVSARYSPVWVQPGTAQCGYSQVQPGTAHCGHAHGQGTA